MRSLSGIIFEVKSPSRIRTSPEVRVTKETTKTKEHHQMTDLYNVQVGFPDSGL